VAQPPLAEGKTAPCSGRTRGSGKSTSPFFGDKYLMHTYQASVRAQVQGRSQVIRTEVRALNAQDARWLLWAQWGFYSIQSGPTQVNTRWAT